MKVFVALATVALMASAIQAGTVTPSLNSRLANGETLDISIYLESISDVFSSKSVLALEGEARVQKMISTLKQRTAASQQPFLDVLTRMKKSPTEIVTLWATNFIRVKNADAALVAALATIPGEFTIREPIVASIVEPTESSPVAEVKQGLQWGVEMVSAEKAWTVTKGEGAVVGIIDSGVYVGHTALKDNFAGAWSDPYYNSATPTDQFGHGTHALGSAVGTANGIGVAPGAKWIACRGLNNQGSGYDAELLGCAEWMLTASPRPNIVSNSWGGGVNDPWYNDVVSAWRTANIIPVFALGNSGSQCRTAISPGDQQGLISVGATSDDDSMAYFSSRGPGPNGSQKPEVSAPGEAIVSAGNLGPNSYSTKSGTSMATPHVAGAIALYISANPTATYAQVLEAITTTGDTPPVTDAERCGGSEWPNMAFGHGRINAAKFLGIP